MTPTDPNNPGGGFRWPWDPAPPPGPGTPSSPDPLSQLPFPTAPNPAAMPSARAFEPAYGYLQSSVDAGLNNLRNAMSMRGITGGQATDIEKNYGLNARTNTLGQLAEMGQRRAEMEFNESGRTGYLGGAPTMDLYRYLSELGLSEAQLTGIYSSGITRPGGFTYQQLAYQNQQQQQQQSTNQWIQYLIGLIPLFL